MRSVQGGTRIGIAIGGESLVAVIAGGSGGPERVRLATGDAPDPSSALATGFAALAARLAERAGGRPVRAELDVVLLPPLAEVRLVPLPPLRQGEAEAVLRRDAARHFINGSQPRAVGVRLPSRRAKSAAPAYPALAAAAPIALLESIHAAAAAAGWRVRTIGPAHAAWARLAGDGDAPVAAVVAVLDGTAHVCRLDDGAVTALRRLRVASAAEIAAACGAGPGRVTLLVERGARPAIAARLEADGWTVAGAGDAGDADAAAAAATHAHAALPALVPPSAYVERARRARTLAGRLAAAAVLLVVAAAGVEWWGAARELETLQARRAAIRAEVGPLLAARDSLERLESRIAAIDGLTGGAPRWTRALFDIALLLPAETHMTRFVASGDTVEIDAAGARAGAALQALRDAETLRDVRLLGVVDRELNDGATAVERFRIGARYARPAPGAPPPPATQARAAGSTP